jgi:hypothetical protein
MSRDPILTALRDASPRNQPEFDESIARYDALRRQITATPAPSHRPGRHLAARRRLIGLSMAAAAVASLVAVTVALTVSASSPASALAAARRALAATAAATSGTMTVTTVQGGATQTQEMTRWNGSDIALTSSTGILGSNRQLLLIGRGAYVQTAGGRWLRYANQNPVGPRLGPAVQLAHDNVAGNTARQVLALTRNIERAAQPDGSTVYTGTIPTRNPDQISNSPADDAIVRLVNNLRGDGSPPVSPNPFDHAPVHYRDLQLKMTVASDGLVKDISLTIRPTAATSSADQTPTTSHVTYTQLGHTPPITAPAKSTPTTPAPSSAGPACPSPPHGPCGG